MNIDWMDKWIEQGIIEEDYFSELKGKIENRGTNLFLLKDVNDNDSFVDLLIYQYHEKNKNTEFLYNEIVNIKNKYDEEQSANQLKIYVSFDNWESEREVIQVLQSKERTAIKKKKIENDFSLFNSVYFSQTEIIKIKVDDEGTNYLTSPEGIDESELSAVVINCSFFELKKLFNETGVELFRSNVREGITDNKSRIKYIIDQYLSLDKLEVLDNNKLSYQNYDAPLFWFSHNGITLFVENSSPNNFTFNYDSITLRPKSCSVINGAQTITNFFFAYSELKYHFRHDEESKSKLRELTKNIFVKLTIIKGKSNYSPFITRGLNTQNPISDEDFIAISDEVKEINSVLSGNLYILKTGEAERKGGMGPLQFIKNFLMVESKPGSSKNFNKNDIESQIKRIHKKIVNIIDDKTKRSVQLKNPNENSIFIDKLAFLPTIEEWWNKKNREKGKNKTLIDKYGKNYFQSFCLLSYEDLISFDEEFIDESVLESKFNELYKQLNELVQNLEPDLQYNAFKDDDLFNKITEYIAKQDLEVVGTQNNLPTEYLKELLQYLQNNKTLPIQVAISEFNEKQNINLSNIRVIRRKNERIAEHFHLSLRTFSSLYQNINIKEKLNNFEDVTKEDFPNFKDSILREELYAKYNIYIVDMDESNEIQKVQLKDNFDFKLLSNYENEVKASYDETIKAFELGNIEYFPKANKETKVHVRPKAQNKDDSFLFTNGEHLTKRTFWITKYYIEDLLKELEKDDVKNSYLSS